MQMPYLWSERLQQRMWWTDRPGSSWAEMRTLRLSLRALSKNSAVKILKGSILLSLFELFCRLNINPSIFSTDGGHGHAAVKVRSIMATRRS